MWNNQLYYQLVGLSEIHAHLFVTCKRRACKRACKVTRKPFLRGPTLHPGTLQVHQNQGFFATNRGFHQKTREDCGCPKFLAARVFRQISTLLENDSPDFPAARNMLSLPGLGHFPARKMAAGKSAPAFGNAPGFSPPRPPPGECLTPLVLTLW